METPCELYLEIRRYLTTLKVIARGNGFGASVLRKEKAR